MIKLIATDVDNTLLDNSSNLPALNRQAILDCLKTGIEVILASGKTIDSLKELVESLGLKLPQITLNGSVTVNNKLEVIDSIKLEPENYFRVIKTIKDKGWSPLVALEDGRIFYEKYTPQMEALLEIGEKLVRIESFDNQYLAEKTVDINIPVEKKDPMDKYLREKFSDDLQVVRSGKLFLDILSKDASKGNALEKIAKSLGIRKEEIAVFGDSDNDLSMFEKSGLRIAVSNAYPEVLESADLLTDENYNSGFGRGVYKHILEK